MSGESVRQRARELFDCGNCAGSGRVMTGAVQSDVCGKCGGSGTKSVTISEIVAFASSESSLARKQEREDCVKEIRQIAIEWRQCIGMGNYKGDPPNIKAAELRADEGHDIANKLERGRKVEG